MGLIAALDALPSRARPRYDRERGALVGSRCASCRAAAWPMRAACHRCGKAALRADVFAPAGTLLTHTKVWIGPPEVPAPYTLGQVRIDDGPLIFCHVRDLPEGAVTPLRVALHLAPSAETTPPFWFAPEPPR